MMRLVVVACFSGLSLVLVGCSSGTAKYGNPVAPPPATAAPTFSVASGSYNSVQTVSIPDATAGAAIYFTTNGTVPTASSTAYTGPIKVSSTETLMAVAIAPGDASSTVATAAYTITLPPDGKAMHGNTPISGAHVYVLAANTDCRICGWLPSVRDAEYLAKWLSSRFPLDSLGVLALLSSSS